MRDAFVRLGHMQEKRVTTQTFHFQQRTQKESSDPRRADGSPPPSSSSAGRPCRGRPRAAWQCRPHPIAVLPGCAPPPRLLLAAAGLRHAGCSPSRARPRERLAVVIRGTAWQHRPWRRSAPAQSWKSSTASQSFGCGAPQEDEPAAQSSGRTRRRVTQGRGRWGWRSRGAHLG